VAINGYEGGQMPLYQRLPKRGFNKPNRKSFAVVNLGIIQKFIDAGKIDAKAEITEDALVAAGLVRRKLDGVRVLAKGDFSAKVKRRHRRVEVGRRGGREGGRLAHGRVSPPRPNKGCGRPPGRLHRPTSFPERRRWEAPRRRRHERDRAWHLQQSKWRRT
jgi:ribosomal protein L15